MCPSGIFVETFQRWSIPFPSRNGWSSNPRPTPLRPILKRKFLPSPAGKPGIHQSYEELARSYARSLVREEVQLATSTPVMIVLFEILEGAFLLTAIALHLVPICIQLISNQIERQNKESQSIDRETSSSKASEETIPQIKTSSMNETISIGMSHFSLWSTACFVTAVVLGSVLRRFYRHQYQDMAKHTPQTPLGLSSIDREEMENNLSRAFAEISHLAGQVEKLRVKVRLINREYGTVMESTQAESNQMKTALHDVLHQLQGTEKKILDLNEILSKMQDFASKQFQVVSSALRRIDKECKHLSAQLPQPESKLTEIEEPAELDFQS